MSVIIGIDPGATGYIVALDSDGIAWSREMPETPAQLADALREHAGATVIVERQQPMPRDRRGVIGGFKSGQGFGRIEGVLAALNCRVYLVRSQDWQKTVLRGEAKAADRKALMALYTEVAERMWPTIVFRGPRGGLLDGKAAAALIAEHGRRMLAGN
jgi:hypothetical protein